MLQIAATWIEQDKKDVEAAKEAYMAENCPNPDLSGDQAALMVRRRFQTVSFLLPHLTSVHHGTTPGQKVLKRYNCSSLVLLSYESYEGHHG